MYTVVVSLQVIMFAKKKRSRESVFMMRGILGFNYLFINGLLNIMIAII
jgi:hypothetical protein